MKPEIVGNQIRIRVKDPKQFKVFRTDDIGEKGKLQRVSGYNKKGWQTQSWRVNLGDYFSYPEAVKDIDSIKDITSSQKSQSKRLAKQWMQ